ncbi:Asp23/Gls24 family envelope stress response protein [Pseudonocardia endophytica]|uniref:Putative alkaline shock family protein YloU n=1 Tax=Pseudonocardia endophytica TaxID=401976 RepID=A0A4R1I767_PSEEN|nr:Asp23/Gls24 family envelope stress response protein [Pseudonocardia endophytica]TCK25952.1 putative alkaline shock family protein YloU [Pseudonocardia endophytica]
MTAAERLTCGRDADAILEQVAEGRAAERDDHQLDCPHCQAALGEYDRLWAPVRESAAEPVAVPDSVVETALGKIRAAMARPDFGLIESPQGVTRISARVVVAAARRGAQEIPGVRVALSKEVDEPGRVTAGVAGTSTAIQITLAADYGHDLVALGEQVRGAVSDTVRRLTGLEPAHVTVVIDDVFR